MAHFNFVISQNAKWRHAGFYIDCHRTTSLVRYRKIFFYKKTLIKRVKSSGLAGSGRKRAGKGIGGIWKRKAEMEDDLA